MSEINLFRKEIEDEFIQENFVRVQEYINDLPLAKGRFKFFEFTVPGAVTNYRFYHNLGFVPKDVIQTFVSGGITVTYNYEQFDRNAIDVTTSGSGTIRVFIGRYEE